jgi:flagellar motor switch protein FliN/FliY
MTDRRPEVAWEPATCTLGEIEQAPDAEMLWWQQSFQILPEPALWVGAPRATWEELGGRTLRSAGLDTVDTADARNTWLEILSQALSTTARVTGGCLSEEVTCSDGSEKGPPADSSQWFRIVLTFETALPPIWVRTGEKLVERMDSASNGSEEAAHEPAPRALAAPTSTVVNSRTMDLLLDVELPVSLSFGRSLVALKDVLKLTTGSIVELDRNVTEPVDVLVNQCLIARGEVVVIDGNYAVRIQQIISPQERLRSMR